MHALSVDVDELSVPAYPVDLEACQRVEGDLEGLQRGEGDEVARSNTVTAEPFVEGGGEGCHLWHFGHVDLLSDGAWMPSG